MTSVFLSHVREDAGKAQTLASLLERAGHSVWWDARIKGGAHAGLLAYWVKSGEMARFLLPPHPSLRLQEGVPEIPCLKPDDAIVAAR